MLGQHRRNDQGHSTNWVLKRSKFAKLFKSSSCYDHETALGRLQAVCAATPDSEGIRIALSHLQNGGIQSLGAGGRGTVEIAADVGAAVCHAYGVSLTRFAATSEWEANPLCIAAQKPKIGSQGISAQDFSVLTSDLWPASPDSPSSCSYLFPKTRLVDANDIEIGVIRLEPGGRSERHVHDGDELLICKSGEVELSLSDVDIVTPIRRGDIAHFYSEQRHRLDNSGQDPAELLIIRHVASSGETKSEGAKHPLLSLEAIQAKPSQAGLKRIKDELYSTLSFGRIVEDNLPETVLDRWGLAYLIEKIYMNVGGLAGLKKISEENSGLQRRDVSRLKLGQAAIPTAELPKIARRFGVSPLMLHEFIYPAYRNAVFHRSDRGYRGVDAGYRHDLGDGATYETPVKRLAVFGVSISQVTVEPHSEVREHQHPGHELIVPLEGSCKVVFSGSGKGTFGIGSSTHEFIHFQSFRGHRLVTEKEGAKFFALRFF